MMNPRPVALACVFGALVYLALWLALRGCG